MAESDEYGLVVRRDLARAGCGWRAIARRAHAQGLEPVLRGVLAPADQVRDPAVRARAAGLLLPPGAAVSGRTAAWVHGVDPRGPGETADPVALECCVPVGRTPQRRAGMRCRQAHLDSRDVVHIGGIPVTGASRTALDLARTEPAGMALACLDAFLRHQDLDPEILLRELDRFGGGRGVVQARRLVALADAGAESYGESWTRLRLLDAGFPRPETQVPVTGPQGRLPYRLDLGWRRRRIGVEYDGEEFHSSPQQVAHDSARREWLLRERGWLVVPVTKGDVLGTRLDLERGIGDLLGMEPAITRRRW